jgi:hypothetical protein
VITCNRDTIMQRESRARRHWLLAVTTISVIAAAACSSSSPKDGKANSALASKLDAAGGSNRVATVEAPAIVHDTARVYAPIARLAPARDVQQEFLRRMLDHHETVIIAVHELMMAPAGHAAHGTKADPAGWDGALDAEKQELAAMLKLHYGEDYSPRATRSVGSANPASSGDMAGMPKSASPGAEDGEAEHMASQARLAADLREGAALVDHYASKLRQPAVRELARRIRASQLALAGKLGMGAPVP